MKTEPNPNHPDRSVDDSPLRERIPRYVISLPERVTRAAIALVGGAVYETSNVALPRAQPAAHQYSVAWLQGWPHARVLNNESSQRCAHPLGVDSWAC